jgi:hypothetical protein
MKNHQTYQKKKAVDGSQPGISPANIFCQLGAGLEAHVGARNLNQSITPEGHGFTKHLVFRSPRNTRRMVQTSLLLTQVWRENVDVKQLLYQSDPSNPDPEDIVACSDYLAGYHMKCAHTLTIEKKHEGSGYEHGRYLWKQRMCIQCCQEAQ